MDVDDSDCLSSISSNWSVMGSSSEFVSASHQVGQPPISDEESPGSMSNGVHKTPPVREDKAVDVEQKGSEKLATDGHFNLAIKVIFLLPETLSSGELSFEVSSCLGFVNFYKIVLSFYVNKIPTTMSPCHFNTFSSRWDDVRDEEGRQDGRDEGVGLALTRNKSDSF